MERFSGAFDKRKKVDYLSYNEITSFEEHFCKKTYELAGNEIHKFLGVKQKYSFEECAKYFLHKYNAFQIPWEHIFNYHTTVLRDFDKQGTYNHDEYAPFEFVGTNEKHIFLVIDTINNLEVRKKYPKILEIEKAHNKEFKENKELLKIYGSYGHSNPIITIGSFDNENVNSMINLHPATDMIPELEYEIWYFYNKT